MSQVCSYCRHKPLKHRVDHNRFNKPLQSPGPTATPVHSPTSPSSLSSLGGSALSFRLPKSMVVVVVVVVVVEGFKPRTEHPSPT